MITEEQKEINKIYKEKLRINKERKQEQQKAEDVFKLRLEFKQRVSRMTEMYIDICDDEWVEPTKEWFIEFIYEDK